MRESKPSGLEETIEYRKQGQRDDEVDCESEKDGGQNVSLPRELTRSIKPEHPVESEEREQIDQTGDRDHEQSQQKMFVNDHR